MNIEIANRLVNLRKQNNLSQEALAEKLGISRQAVSKWERAEASPDTDNLILLARLYGVSLDELLQTEDEIIPRDREEEQSTSSSDDTYNKKDGKRNPYEDIDNSYSGDYVKVGLDGIHVRDKDGTVHVGWKGIHVEEHNSDKESVEINSDGVFINGEEVHVNGHLFKKKDHSRLQSLLSFPVDLFVIMGYIAYGAVTNIWHPTWIVFLLIPIWHSIISAILNKDLSEFVYPVLMTALYLYIGFEHGAWHPGWVVFLTIPLFYGLVDYIKKLFFHKEKKTELNLDEES